MPLNNQKKIIIFEGTGDKDQNKIIREILKNNGLEETSDDYFKKARSGKEPWFKTLYKSSKLLASGDTTEEDFISSIQNQLQIPQQDAKNILKEIKDKLLPSARMLGKDELEEESASNMSARPSGQPMNIPKAIEKDMLPLTEEPMDNVTIPAKKQPRIKKPIVQEEIKESTPQTKQSKGPDRYREPIG